MKTFTDIVCTQCGCLCDDIVVAVENNQIVAARRACVLGKPWFLAERAEAGPGALIDGAPASQDEAVLRAAELLQAARYPLVLAMSDLTCQAQRAAAALAERIGGTIDLGCGSGGSAEMLAMRNVGKVTATLGEVASRADLVVFWRTDPAATHPRHFVRYSLLPRGSFTPGGRRDRTCVVVDRPRIPKEGFTDREVLAEVPWAKGDFSKYNGLMGQSKTGAAADIWVPLEPEKEFESLSVLRAVVRGMTLDDDKVQTATGTPLAGWQFLAEMMSSAKYGALFYEPDDSQSVAAESARMEALFRLTRELNAHARFVAIANLGAGNLRGAENVLTWRTGYPGPVNFGLGHPRHDASEFSAEAVLSRGEADLALLVGESATEKLSTRARERLASIPRVVLTEGESHIAEKAAVVFKIATDGIHTPGTMFRMDGVPLPVRPILKTSRPSAQAVLEAIAARLRQPGEPRR